MPTSKSRRPKLVARQKRREKAALRTKLRLGLNVQNRSLQKNTAISTALLTITDCLKKAIKIPELSNLKKTDVAESSEVLDTGDIAIPGKGSNESYEIETSSDNKKNYADVPFAPSSNELSNVKVCTSLDGFIAPIPGNDCCIEERVNNPLGLISPRAATSTLSNCRKQTFAFLFGRSMSSILHIGNFPMAITKRIIKKIRSLYCTSSLTFQQLEEFELLKERVANAEREIQLLKDIINDKGQSLHVTKYKADSGSNEVNQIGNQTQLLPASSSHPPPPPPPPPPLQPCLINRESQAVKVKRSRKESLKKASCNQMDPNNVCVTKDQLLKVKLKKVSFDKENNTSAKRKKGIVTLQDLQSVKLRKIPSGEYVDNATPLRDTTNFGSKILTGKCGYSVEKRTPLSGYNLRKTLRKVNIIRSPGGTPLIKSNLECGQGTTPMIARALKSKFKNTMPSSLDNSPDF